MKNLSRLQITINFFLVISLAIQSYHAWIADKAVLSYFFMLGSVAALGMNMVGIGLLSRSRKENKST